MTQKVREYGKWILTAVAFLWCVVIWQFSLAPATDSSATSGAVRAFVNNLLSSVGIPFQFTPTMVRKIAHFSEFFVLGVLAHAALRAHRFSHSFGLAAISVLAVATLDECIQIFVPGRGPGVLDVLLDTAGGITGALAFWGVCSLVFYIYKKRKENHEKFSESS